MTNMLGHQHQPLPIVLRETLLKQVQFTHISLYVWNLQDFCTQSPDNPVLLDSSNRMFVFIKVQMSMPWDHVTDKRRHKRCSLF